MRISGTQLFWIIATIYIVSAIGITITPTLAIVKQDAWISLLAAGGVVAAITFLLARLAVLHPHQTLVQFSITLLGKWFGRIIVLPYFFAWIGISAVVVRAEVDFIHSMLLSRTPEWIIMFVLLSLVAYLAYGGITNIGRFGEMVGLTFYVLIFLSFLLNMKNIKLGKLLPIYTDHNWTALLKGMLPHIELNGGEAVLLLVLVSFVSHSQKASKRSALAAGLASLTLLISAVMCIIVIGTELSIKLNTPFFVLIRVIDIMDFIQNLDVLFVFVSIFATVIKLSSYSFIVSYEMAQWLNKQNWRIFIWFVILLIVIISIFINGAAALWGFLKLWSSIVIPVCVFGIPLLLWIVTIFKRKLIH